MRKFDHDGLLLAEYQGKLFEKSHELNCSSGIFFRRFYHSDLLENLDTNNPAALSLDVNEGIACLTAQFGDTKYGKTKFPAGTLFWIGYMYRYIAYTRQQSTKFIMQLFDYRKMNDVYFAYHTQDPEWCIRNLLAIYDLTEDIFDNNYRLKQIIQNSEHA